MDDDWYYAGADRSPVGPCSRAELDSLRARGDLDEEALVWTRGMGTWVPFSRLGGLHPRPASDTGVVGVEQSVARAEPTTLPIEAPFAGPGVAHVPASDPGIGNTSRQGFRDAARGHGLPPVMVVEDDGWQYAGATPWRRYFARMFDTIVLGASIWFVLGTLLLLLDGGLFDYVFEAPSPADNLVVKSILTFALVLPVEAWMLGVSGTTPGKRLFGVRVTRSDGDAIGFVRALRREGRVLLQGLALGIPLFSMIAMIVAFFRLKSEGVAGWDAGKPWVVTGRAPGVVQALLFVAGVLLLIAILVGTWMFGQAHSG